VVVEHDFQGRAADATGESLALYERAPVLARLSDEELARRSADRGDRPAADLLVRRYLRLARALARRYAHTSEPAGDLAQVARSALIAALPRFDPARGDGDEEARPSARLGCDNAGLARTEQRLSLRRALPARERPDRRAALRRRVDPVRDRARAQDLLDAGVAPAETRAGTHGGRPAAGGGRNRLRVTGARGVR
jgi:sigma-70-like protein